MVNGIQSLVAHHVGQNTTSSSIVGSWEEATKAEASI
jgi:hypothetical protein